MLGRAERQRSSLTILMLLLIVGLCVAIFNRLVTDGALTLFMTPSGESVVAEYIPEPQVDELIEKVIIPVAAAPLESGAVRYLEVIDSCGVQYDGECLLVRGGTGKDFPVVGKLRKGIVLRTDESEAVDGTVWHKIIFDEWLRYPERVSGDWYVAGEYTEIFYNDGALEYKETQATGTKRILIDRSEQTLYAYNGEDLYMEASISTGLELTPTPRGIFYIFRKTPSRYMQGPLPYLADKQYYDLPGVPWNLYFTEGGAAIHGTYWHNNFGSAQSHGCVNMRPEEAKKLYEWAELGTEVVVQD